MTDENDRPDPSDFTGTGSDQPENQDETTESSPEQEDEDISQALEPSDDRPEGPFWTFTGKVRGMLSPGSEEGEYEATASGEGEYEEGEIQEESYDENGKSRRGFLYAIAGLAGIGGAAIAADGVDGDVDGNFEIFDGIGGGAPAGNETDEEGTPGVTPTDEGTPQATPEQTPEATATPQGTPESETLYFDSLNDLPDEACYVEEGGVSGYFNADDIENVLGEEVTEGLNASRGDIAYDVDFRDSNGDGQPDAYVMQLAGTNDQNDLTVGQAETLFEELDVEGNYC